MNVKGFSFSPLGFNYSLLHEILQILHLEICTLMVLSASLSKEKHEKQCQEESTDIMIKTICSNTDISHSSGIYFSLNFEKQQSWLKEMFQDFLNIG